MMNLRSATRGCVVLLCCALFGELASAQPAPPPAAAAPAPDQPAPPPLPPAPPPPPPATAPVPQPQYAAPPPGYEYRLQRTRPPREPRRPRRSRGMMIGGIVLFGVSYLVPAIIGGGVGSLDRDQCDCHDAYRMFIPVVGPLTLLHDDREYNPLNALLITTTVLQSAGIILSVFGIMRYAASAREEEEYDYGRLTPRLKLVAAPLPGGAYGALQLRL